MTLGQKYFEIYQPKNYPIMDEGPIDDEEQYENFANFALIMEIEEAVQN